MFRPWYIQNTLSQFWLIDWDETELLSLKDCDQSLDCHAPDDGPVPMIEVWDGMDTIISGGYSCANMGTLELTLQYRHISSAGGAPIVSPSEADCIPGSGDFRLVPWIDYDEDADGLNTVVFKAVQTSGTGQMTGDASVDTIRVLEDQGQILNVVHSGSAYELSSNDLVVPSNSIVKLLPKVISKTFSNGQSGTASFIVEELSSNVTRDFSVHMDWTCDSTLSGDSVMPQGFKFSGSACSSPFAQNFTVRPLPQNDPKRVEVTIYGHTT